MAYLFKQNVFFLLIMLLSVKVWAQNPDSNAYVLRGKVIHRIEMKDRIPDLQTFTKEKKQVCTLEYVELSCPPARTKGVVHVIEPVIQSPSHRYTMEAQILNNSDVYLMK